MTFPVLIYLIQSKTQFSLFDQSKNYYEIPIQKLVYCLLYVAKIYNLSAEGNPITPKQILTNNPEKVFKIETNFHQNFNLNPVPYFLACELLNPA